MSALARQSGCTYALDCSACSVGCAKCGPHRLTHRSLLLKRHILPLSAGNRAPMGIYVHSPWFTADNTQALKQFVSYALSLPDVWFVTARQAVEYMKAPVPKSQMGSFIKCRPVDFAAESEPASGLVLHVCCQHVTGWFFASLPRGRWSARIVASPCMTGC
jgi:hypothetical protein